MASTCSGNFDLFEAVYETPDLLGLVVQQFGGNKNNLRLACSRLRAAVDACVTGLAWTRIDPLVKVSEHMAVLARCPRLQTLNFSGCPVADFSPLASCVGLRSITGVYLRANWPHLGQILAPFAALSHLEHLDCSHCTGLADISALSSCMALKYLDCNRTGIKQLPPLSACLETLICHNTPLFDISALVACTALKLLDCIGCRSITILPPLPASLETLNISGSQCVDLAPLAACIGLRSLAFFDTPVQDLAPLAACIGLRWLDCSCTPVRNLLPLLVCTQLEVLCCHGFDGVDDHTSLLLRARPDLNISINMNDDGEDEDEDDEDGDGDDWDEDGEDYFGDSMSDGDSD